MKVLSCAAVGRRLQAYHDDELSVGHQIEVDAHLESCAECAAALEDLDTLRSVLRAATPGRVALTGEEHAGFHAAIVSRVGVEHRLSLPVRMRALFEDMHFVYAGLGAAAATVSCITIMLSMMNFAALTNPGFNQNPVVVDARMLLERNVVDSTMYSTFSTLRTRVIDQGGFDAAHGDDDGAFTWSAVVTREGRLVNLEVYPDDGQPAASSIETRAVQTMLGAMSQTRFEPARVAGLPIAVNMIWLVTHTTVRGTSEPRTVPTVPVAKKRRVEVNVAPSARKITIA